MNKKLDDFDPFSDEETKKSFRLQTDDEIRNLAIRWVCPMGGQPTTPYEIHAVDNLIRFAKEVEKLVVEQPVHYPVWTDKDEEINQLNIELAIFENGSGMTSEEFYAKRKNNELVDDFHNDMWASFHEAREKLINDKNR